MLKWSSLIIKFILSSIDFNINTIQQNYINAVPKFKLNIKKILAFHVYKKNFFIFNAILEIAFGYPYNVSIAGSYRCHKIICGVLIRIDTQRLLI